MQDILGDQKRGQLFDGDNVSNSLWLNG